MNEILLTEATERYLKGEMTDQERRDFEQARRENADLDQFVVDQQSFLQQLDQYAGRKSAKHQLHQIHQKLLDDQTIDEQLTEPKAATIIDLWKKYKRTIAVAASIAGVTALSISAAIQLLSPKASPGELQNLNRKITQLESKQVAQNKKIDQLIQPAEKTPGGEQLSGGTSFLIDGDGYLVTNYHVVSDASTLLVSNNGRDFLANMVFSNEENDLAILKINDPDWKPYGQVPYTIRKNNVDLGEELFTLGYPRNSIVYNRGYLSAGTGYNDDSLSIQLSISANPGNSGGPVLDKNGNVIGILSTRDRQADDVVFATKALNISRAVEQMRSDAEFKNLQLPARSSLRNLNRVDQIKKLQECIYMVKVY